MTVVMFAITFTLAALVVLMGLRKRGATPGIAGPESGTPDGTTSPEPSCTSRCRCRH